MPSRLASSIDALSGTELLKTIGQTPTNHTAHCKQMTGLREGHTPVFPAKQPFRAKKNRTKKVCTDSNIYAHLPTIALYHPYRQALQRTGTRRQPAPVWLVSQGKVPRLKCEIPKVGGPDGRSSCLTPGTSHLTLPRLALFRTAPAVAPSLPPCELALFRTGRESVLLPFNPQSAKSTIAIPKAPAGWLLCFRTLVFCHGMVPRGLPAFPRHPTLPNFGSVSHGRAERLKSEAPPAVPCLTLETPHLTLPRLLCSHSRPAS